MGMPPPCKWCDTRFVQSRNAQRLGTRSMFDYQAGEKYRLTLVMVGVAGLIAGMFFAILLMPTSEAPSRAKRVAMTRAMTDPDVTGGRGAGGRAQQIAANVMAQANPVDLVDRSQAQM